MPTPCRMLELKWDILHEVKGDNGKKKKIHLHFIELVFIYGNS